MKIKGKEFKEWYDNHFPEGYYFDSPSDNIDDVLHDANGEWQIEDGKTYDTDDLGCLLAETNGTPEIDAATCIKRWRKSRDFDLITVEVKRGDSERVKAAILALGCKVR